MPSTEPPGPACTDPLYFIASPTPQLRAVVAEQQSLLEPADFRDLINALRGIFDKYTGALWEAAPGADRAGVLHRLVDQSLEAAGGIAVSCRKGCCGCCHCEVEVTADEAEVLRQEVAAGTIIDRRRLKTQAQRERKSAQWERFWSQENRCVFLGADGACQIYASRPSACRKLVVTTPAEACTTAGAEVAPLRILLADIALSAALSLPGAAVGSMSKMLEPLLAPDGPAAA